jgi:hypothetical protein
MTAYVFNLKMTSEVQARACKSVYIIQIYL